MIQYSSWKQSSVWINAIDDLEINPINSCNLGLASQIRSQAKYNLEIEYNNTREEGTVICKGVDLLLNKQLNWDFSHSPIFLNRDHLLPSVSRLSDIILPDHLLWLPLSEQTDE